MTTRSMVKRCSKRIVWLRSVMMCVVMALMLNGVSGAAYALGKSYLLGPGDRIKVHVYNESDLSIETEIGRSGNISFPFLGEVRAEGFTVLQLAQEIERGLLGDYLVDPHVQVSVVQYRPFFIHGQVNSPGGYPYQPGLTIDMAIALAGGLKERASKDKWFIRRATEEHEKRYKAKRETFVMAGDIIEISESFF
ncbi:polysaccharide biosynthesis/export family protein [Echinimonas agarilytica]|uniref:Polysaccharide export protein n=1 Tax=Echinimonas agarilytica TaxID=1215918 RepID=A0AA42B6K0_9GAMM|nr:polysaccharide biosynthesis/export family protein [Echinimonas agarilytica]MCM2678536.1 polysaccharide export protein [Echinimonas agarilytica]